ncbi:hypothetical protein BH11MYX4_BH11MYX4_54610 [soil metagenome]
MAAQGTIVRRPWVATAASVALVATGLFLTKVSILDVLDAAERHDPSISFSVRAIVVSPIFVILGIVATIASFSKPDPEGRAASRLVDQRTRKLSPIGWAVVVGVLAIGGGIFLYVRSRLASYGYDL